jgi:hypothetical protein
LFRSVGVNNKTEFRGIDFSSSNGPSEDFDRKDSVMRRILVVGFVWILILSAGPVLAWNDVGHMTVARIAYDRLTDGEKAAVVAILLHHPHLQELLLKNRPHEATKAEWIFLRAATWPDNVRPPRVHEKAPVAAHPVYQFHHPSWHFANFEYRSGQNSSELPRQPMPRKSDPGKHKEHTNIIEQLDHSYLIVRGREREASEPEKELSLPEIRAIRMCWLFHLMGDIHQPLHVATLVNTMIPELEHGDEGGNKLAVRLDYHTAPRKLHAVWDDLMGTNARFEKIVELAERLSHDPRLASSHLLEFTYHRYAREFAAESYLGAKEIVFQEGRLGFSLWSRVEKFQVPAENVPVMSDYVQEQAYAFAHRRITLAGYRLAERLKYIVQHDHDSTDLIGTTDLRPVRVTPSRHLAR